MEVRERGTQTSVLETCPYCSCGCGLHLMGTVGEILGVGPSEHHPVSAGRLCARGWAAHEPPLWGPRIRHPLIREDGRLVPCSWERATTRAADSLSSLVSAKRAVGVLGSGRASNEENFLAAALARAALRTGHLDAPLRSPYEHTLRGLAAASGIPALHSSLEGLAASDLILVLEGDLAASHPRVAYAVLQARRRGARLVTLGWSPTRMSRLAAAHLVLPPTDPLSPLRALADAARGCATADGGQAEAVREVASWLVASRRPALVLGVPQSSGPLLEAAASLLAGALSRGAPRNGSDGAGPVVVPLPARANSRGAREMGVAPHLLPGCLPLDDAPARDRLTRVWGREPVAEQGLPAEDMLASVSGLVVVAEDLPAWAPSPAGALGALEALDTLVVLDSWLTPTACRAHVVLPIAAFGEGWGTFTNLEGRVQLCRPVVHPPGEAREGWSALSDLLRALGVPVPFTAFGGVFAAVGKSVPQYGSLRLDDLEGGPSEPLRPGAGAVVPVPVPGPAGRAAAEPSPARPGSVAPENGHWIVRMEGAFEWGDDPQVVFSPTLRRDPASFRKLHPEGVVWINPDEAKALGVREGWKVRLRSATGEAEVPVSLRPGLGRKLLLVPFAFRDELRGVLGGAEAAEVALGRP